MTGQLYEWPVVKILLVIFEYSTAKNHGKKIIALEERTLEDLGKQKICCVIPFSKDQV
jgi:hypothetical protein